MQLNLNSICTRDKIKISLLETYNSIHHLEIIALSETMLNSAVSNDEITIEGFSNDILRSDHPSDAKIGGACIYFRDGLPIRHRKEFELLQEMLVTEIRLGNKKIVFATLYHSPIQRQRSISTVHRQDTLYY